MFTGRMEQKSNNTIQPGAGQIVQREGKYLSPLLCVLLDFVILLLATEGLAIGFFKAFSFGCFQWVIYLVTAVLSMAFTLFFSVNIPKRYKQYTYAAGIGVCFLFIITNTGYIKQGFSDCVKGMLTAFNFRYQGKVELESQVLSEGKMTIFFLILMAVIVLILAFSTIVAMDTLLVFLIEFPIFMMIVFMGSNVSGVSLLFILFHFFSCVTQGHALMGKERQNHINPAEEEKNKRCLRSVQKKAACIMALGMITASVISVYLIMPLMPEKFASIQKLGAALQNQVISVAVEYLPIITGGEWNLRVQTVGGGVEDGGLGEVAGYSLTNIEDLIVTSTVEPKETIYLCGYVGSIYEENKWLEQEETIFQNASIYWHTEGVPALYVHNLPFLRKLYEEQKEAQQSSQMAIITVEKLNASEKYAYVPYCAFLNDYYEISGGDGSVKGQNKAEDEFSYFSIQNYVEAMEGRSLNEEEGILDRVEVEYNSYVKTNYLWVPEGFERLEEQCKAQEIKEGDIDEIVRYITTFLVSNYEYNIQVPRLPKDKDFVQYFLYESKEGYSAHFASTAVLMFRMFDVPARYVTGYAAPASIFSPTVEGNYTALLQSDNSHAWAEIYMEGIGWIPIETTPGNIGVLQNIYGNTEEEENHTLEDEEEKQADELVEEETKEERQEEEIYRQIRNYLGILIPVFLVGLILFFVIRKVRYELKKRGYSKKETASEKVLSIFYMLHETLCQAGMPKEVRSTSPEFQQWLSELIPELSKKHRELVVRLALASAYGEKQVTIKEVYFMRYVYKKCRKGLKKYKKVSKEEHKKKKYKKKKGQM